MGPRVRGSHTAGRQHAYVGLFADMQEPELVLCSMKTSMFKWKPELEVAAMAYDQAAACFKLAKEYELCIEACIQVSVAANRRDLPHTRIKRTPSVCLNSVCTHSNG